MATAFVNGRVLTARGFEAATVVVDGDRITAVEAEGTDGGDQRIDLKGAYLLPGFIDTQVNGGGGVLFNATPTVEAIATIGAAHRRFGTTGFLPTLISDDLATVEQAIVAVDAAIEQGVPGVLGIHIEGPFLAESRKGVHDASKFRTLDEAAFRLLTSARRGRTLVTLAPETTTDEMIARLRAGGVTVAAGHTNATYERLRSALEAGLTGFTHLFNAMSPLTSRAPGAVGAALDDADSWCGIIVDGRHIHPATLGVAFRAKRHDRFMLVTDAMPSVGMADKTFVLQGRTIRVVDGVCLDEDGTLAGSDLDMMDAVRNAVRLTGLDLQTAVEMASANPAAFLRMDGVRGRIVAGAAADLVVADEDLNVVETWIAGRRYAD